MGDMDCKLKISLSQSFTALLKYLFFFFLEGRKLDVLYVYRDVEKTAIHLLSLSWYWLIEKGEKGIEKEKIFSMFHV